MEWTTGTRCEMEVAWIRMVAVESRKSEEILDRFWKWSCRGFVGGLDVECETKEGDTYASPTFWCERLRRLTEGRNQERKFSLKFPLVIQMKMVRRQLGTGVGGSGWNLWELSVTR